MNNNSIDKYTTFMKKAINKAKTLPIENSSIKETIGIDGSVSHRELIIGGKTMIDVEYAPDGRAVSLSITGNNTKKIDLQHTKTANLEELQKNVNNYIDTIKTKYKNEQPSKVAPEQPNKKVVPQKKKLNPVLKKERNAQSL